MIKENRLLHKQNPFFSYFLKYGIYIMLIITAFFFAEILLSYHILVLYIVIFLCVAIMIILYRPKLYFLGLLVSLPIVFLTHNIRFAIFGLSSRPGASGLNPQTVLIVFSIFIYIFYILLSKFLGKKLFDSPVLKPILAFLLISAVGLFLTADLSAAVPDFMRSAGGLLIFLIAFAFLDKKNTITNFMQLFVIILYIPIIIGYLQVFGLISYAPVATQLGSFGLVNRISCGYYDSLTVWCLMLFYYPFLFFLYIQRRYNSKMVFLIFSFVFPLPVLYFTFYRAGLAILFAEILLWFIFTKRNRWAVLIVIITAIFVILQWHTFSSYYSSVWEPFGSSQGDPGFYSGFHGRIGIWTSYLNFFQNQHALNKLIGLGPYVGDPHNNFLWVLLATGFLGLGIYLWMLVTIFREINVCIRNSKEAFLINLSIMVKVIFIAFLIISLTTEPVTDVGFQWYLFSFLSVIAKANWDRRVGLVETIT